MLYLAGVIITFFLAIVLLGKRNKSRADYLLTVWLLLIGVHLCLYYSVFSHEYLHFPYLLGLEIPLPLVYGPMLYLYTSELTHQKEPPKYRVLHFLPVFFAYWYTMPFYRLENAQKVWVYQHEGSGFRTQQFYLLVAIIVSGISYSILSLVKLYRHQKHIGDRFSNIEKINLAWLRYLIFGMALIWSTVFLDQEEYIFSTVVMFVFFIGYFGIRQAGIFTDRPEQYKAFAGIDDEPPEMPQESNATSVPPEAATDDEGTKKNKYAKSGLNADIARSIHQRLDDLMKAEKLFTDPELTLAQLSEKLNTNANHLSQVINTIENKNFYDYINTLRVIEFMRISCLPENQKYTLLHLSLECGFNSKTSFNRNFKKHTGLSPSEFLAQRNIILE